MKLRVIAIVLLSVAIARAGEIEDQFLKAKKAGQIKETVIDGKDWDNPPATGVSEIGIECTPCFGSCPVYTLIIKSDGTFRYHGDHNVARVGDYTGKIPPRRFAKIAALIKEIEFAKLDDSYTAGVTDQSTVYITAVIDGQRKIVSDYASAGPAKLWALEQVISDVADHDVEWKPSAARHPAGGKEMSQPPPGGIQSRHDSSR